MCAVEEPRPPERLLETAERVPREVARAAPRSEERELRDEVLRSRVELAVRALDEDAFRAEARALLERERLALLRLDALRFVDALLAREADARVEAELRRSPDVDFARLRVDELRLEALLREREGLVA